VKHTSLAVIAVLMIGVAGCASAPGASRFTPVSLTKGLDAASLARYHAEADRVRDAGQEGHVLVLEQSNAWPLGLLAYWRQGTVKATGGSYTVTVNRGYGPLSMFYVRGRTATFNENGERLHAMENGGVLWGHLAMVHSMDPGGGHVHR